AQPVRQELKRRGVELQRAIRARLDQLAEFVTMALAGFQKRQNKQFSAALLQLTLEFFSIDILHNNILCNKLHRVKRKTQATQKKCVKCRLAAELKRSASRPCRERLQPYSAASRREKTLATTHIAARRKGSNLLRP